MCMLGCLVHALLHMGPLLFPQEELGPFLLWCLLLGCVVLLILMVLVVLEVLLVLDGLVLGGLGG